MKDPWAAEVAGERLAAAARPHKLASEGGRGHKPPMRLLIPAAVILLLSACGSNPKPLVVSPPAAPEQRERGDLIGMSASELVARFGTPRLQVREGDGTKLQFEAPDCVLDAYLYPPASGAGLARATHVDTRNRDGRSVDQAGCLAMIERR